MGIKDAIYIKRICPSCNKEFYPGACEIVSPNIIDATTGKHEPLKSAPSGLKKRLALINPEPITGELVLKLAHRECPHCYYLLPTNIEQVDNINIAIVGDTFSGKSHFIGALIHQIQQGELQRADQYARFDCMTQDVEREYITRIIKPLFQDKQVVAATQPWRAGTGDRPPLIYELILSPSPEHPARRINLVLYDAAGEDLAIKERMVQFSRYVFSANAIIFLADPTSMPEIYNLLPAFLQPGAATGRRSSPVLNSIIRLIEDFRGSGARLSSTPIAITVTKSDLLKQLTSIQQQYHFLKKPVYNGAINLQDLDTVDREVRHLLTDYGERTLLSATQNFSKVRFFATSATGYAPDMNGKYPAVDPIRCLDPIFWILHELDILHAV
jgi:GTPase SAR1 family protein